MGIIKRNNDYLWFLEKVNLKCIQVPFTAEKKNLRSWDRSLVGRKESDGHLSSEKMLIHSNWEEERL